VCHEVRGQDLTGLPVGSGYDEPARRELEHRALVMTPMPPPEAADPDEQRGVPMRDTIGNIEPRTFTDLVVVGYLHTTRQVRSR
jgi:hypothetical protein